jgi:hypothetical protein
LQVAGSLNITLAVATVVVGLGVEVEPVPPHAAAIRPASSRQVIESIVQKTPEDLRGSRACITIFLPIELFLSRRRNEAGKY